MGEVKFTAEERQQYEEWRAKHQAAENAAKAAWRAARYEWEKAQQLQTELAELKEQMAAVGAGGVEPLRKAAAAQAAVPETREALGKRLIADVKVANAIAAVACQRVAELPDRDSPADWPEAMLVTGDELHMIVREAAIEAQAAPTHPAEGATAQAFKTKVYQALGIGSACDEHVVFANIENLIRREHCLSAIEREFFMVETPPDEGEGDTGPGEECLLNWGHTPDQYVKQFAQAIATHPTKHGL